MSSGSLSDELLFICVVLGTDESDWASGGGSAFGSVTSAGGDLGTGKLMSTS